jgi:hypothetical protein
MAFETATGWSWMSWGKASPLSFFATSMCVDNQMVLREDPRSFFGEVLQGCSGAGEIGIGYDANGFIRYFDLAFPLKIETYVHLLTHQLSTLRVNLGSEHPDLAKFSGFSMSSGRCHRMILRKDTRSNSSRKRSEDLLKPPHTNSLMSVQTFNGTIGNPGRLACSIIFCLNNSFTFPSGKSLRNKLPGFQYQ